MGTLNQLFAARENVQYLQLCEHGVIIHIEFSDAFYDDFSDFFAANPQFEEYRHLYGLDRPPIETEFNVIGWGVHPNEAKIIYVLQDPDTEHIFLFDSVDGRDDVFVCGYESGFGTDTQWRETEHILDKMS